MAGEHRFHLDPELGLVVERFTGRLGLHDVLEAGKEVDAHPDFRKGMRYLVDLRSATATLRAVDVQALSDFIKTSDEGAKVAVVVARTLEFGIARMLSALAEGHAVEALHVFWDVPGACAWLGVEPVTLDDIGWWSGGRACSSPGDQG